MFISKTAKQPKADNSQYLSLTWYLLTADSLWLTAVT